MECTYCKHKLSSKSALKMHQKSARYCLKAQGVENIKGGFICDLCGKDFQNKSHMINHLNICEKNTPNMKKILEENNSLKNDNNLLENIIIELRNQIKDYKELSMSAVKRPFEQETIIDIDQYSDDEQPEEYKLNPLEVGQGFIIEHREEDGYINVTNLCKAGGKLFKNWKKTQKTKDFLQVLSSVVPNGTTELIILGTGSKNIKNSIQGTWVHPQVAINIAQWISPQFDVKVSGWVYEIMMTGKVDITNTTSYKQLQKENKDQQIKIHRLTKKYVKAQPRVQYEERNVVYILTTKLMKKDRRYILGKATNLTSRLSVYNKSDEHQVVYYGQCKDENTMGIVETMVFSQLEKYREQANRERFLLPEKEEIEFFSNIINKSIEFFNK
jgi:hypothetical protein